MNSLLLSDLITASATRSADWTTELAQARRQYWAERNSGVPEQTTRQAARTRRLEQINPQLREQLASTGYRRQNIIRQCLRLGIPAAPQLRILGAIVID